MPVLHICCLEDRKEHFSVLQEFRDCLIIGRGAISLASLSETRLDQSYNLNSFLLVKKI